jgi:glutamate formiminotransferase
MLMECVPNVSEGRRPQVIDALAGIVRALPGVRLLDYSSDPSHNRSVFTFVGAPNGVRAAALAVVEAAIERIDLRTHRGQHPRLGAVDVVPFVPLEGATMADCIAVAREVGAVVGQRFHVPVFLYDEAAAVTARRNLEDIRRDQFEGLAARMALPEWAPDFGPKAPHPTAGAVAIGARPLLVAYNVNLATDRLDVARQIARSVRASNGGFPSVKALGLALPHRGIVQVSINLTDYRTTPIWPVFERVRAEAAQRGVLILDSEVIGLVPAGALAGTTPDALKLKDFTAARILENRLQDLKI